jgi:hypothetical protein
VSSSSGPERTAAASHPVSLKVGAALVVPPDAQVREEPMSTNTAELELQTYRCLLRCAWPETPLLPTSSFLIGFA